MHERAQDRSRHRHQWRCAAAFVLAGVIDWPQALVMMTGSILALRRAVLAQTRLRRDHSAASSWPSASA